MKVKQHRSYSIILLCGLIFLTSRCTQTTSPFIETTGGETLNERYVAIYMHGGKQRAKNATVSIGFTGGDNEAYYYVTDSNGVLFIPPLKDSLYSIFIEKVDSSDSSTYVAFQDSVFISPDTHTVQNDTLRLAGELRGYVRLEEYDNRPEFLKRGIVHILGTSKNVHVDSTGAFSLKNVVPGAEYDLKVVPNARGYREEFRSIYFPDNQTIYQMDTIKLEIDTLPPVFIKSLDYDSLRGITKVTWKPLNGYDIISYNVFKSRLSGTNPEYARMHIGFTTDNVFLDTLFSNTPKSSQLSLDDTNSYTYRYNINALSSHEQSVQLDSKTDTVTVRSPWFFRSEIKHQLLDSATNNLIPNAIISRTLAVAFSIENNRWPVQHIRIRDEQGSEIYKRELDTALTTFFDTLYFNWPTRCNKSLYLSVLDEDGNERPFCRDTIRYEVTDFNLYVANMSILPEFPVAGKPLGGKVEIGCLGKPDMKDVNIDVALYSNEVLIMRQVVPIELFENGKRVPVLFDTTIADTVKSPGIYSMRATVNELNAVYESEKKDNSITSEVFVSDIDLEIVDLVFDSTYLFDTNKYRCGVKIRNSGTTDYYSGQYHSKVAFNIDDNFNCWGFLDTIKAGDSITVWGLYNTSYNSLWPATYGLHYIWAKLDPEKSIPELNKGNNHANREFFVDDYNLAIRDLEVFFNDSLTKVTGTAKITRSGSVVNPAHPNNGINNVKVILKAETVADTFFIPASDLAAKDSFTFPIRKSTDQLFFNGKKFINFTIAIDPENHLRETSESDNNCQFQVEKDTFYVNGTFDRKNPNSSDSTYGWVPDDHFGFAEFEWNDNGEHWADSRTISIEIPSSVKSYACWKYPLTGIVANRFYWVRGSVRGYSIEQEPGATMAPISVGFDGTGFLIGVSKADAEKSWTDFAGIIKASDGQTSYALSCNLGFDNNTNKVSGTAYFDDIMLEGINEKHIRK